MGTKINRENAVIEYTDDGVAVYRKGDAEPVGTTYGGDRIRVTSKRVVVFGADDTPPPVEDDEEEVA